jgi:hypothetical protein
MNQKLLIIGDPAGNHTLAALRKYPAESITVWEHPDNFYTIRQISDKITLVNSIDSLEMNFDLIIANPPYQSTSNSGNTLWDKFVAKSLDLLKPGGHMKFINPPRWRQPEDALSYIYRDYQLVSLSIHSSKDGNKTFGASTPYDVYHIEKVKPYKDTHIRFIDGTEGDYDVTQLPFIPNSMMEYWLKAFDYQGDRLTVFHSYSHEDRCKHMSKKRTDTHVYPIVQKVTSDGLHYHYSSKSHIHQDVQKIVFRDQGKPCAQLSSHGCGKHTYYTLNTSARILDFLNGDEFDKIRESVLFSHRQVFPKPLSYIPLETI